MQLASLLMAGKLTALVSYFSWAYLVVLLDFKQIGKSDSLIDLRETHSRIFAHSLGFDHRVITPFQSAA